MSGVSQKSKRANTGAQKRAVIYARVSTKEQRDEGFSIEAQLALLRSYAAVNQFEIIGEYVESESAKIAGRTAFSAMLKTIKAESVSAVLVEKTDRLYRNLKDYVRVDELDLEVHLVKEGEVISRDSRSHQKFVHGIKLLMARNYSDNLSEEAKKGMYQKAKEGIWPTKAPLGYLNVSVGSRRVIEPDPERSELVRWLFTRYAEGLVSLKTLKKEATYRGLTTRKGRAVMVNELHTLLQSPVYYGVICWSGEEFPGIHTPLVDKSTFDRVQEVIHGRNRTKEKPSAKREFLYRGLFTCGRCGCSISPQVTKGHCYYACSGARGCPRKTVSEEAITEAIARRLSDLTIRPEVLAVLRNALIENSTEEERLREEEVSMHKSNRDSLKARLKQLYFDKLNGTVSDSLYSELKIQWETELMGAEVAIEAFGKARRLYEDECLALVGFASNAYSRFKTASWEDKRGMAQNLLSNSTITDGYVQVSFHKAFEMILEANAEMDTNPPQERVLRLWLAD